MFFSNLETPRLFLKNIDREDREFMLKEFSNNLVNEYLYDEEPMQTLEEADDLIRFYLEEEPRDQHRWILIRKEDGTKMGTCGFHRWNREENRCEIGYDLYPDFQRCGYMREALEEILRFAKEQMKVKRIDAHIAVENERSKHAVEQYGFVDSKEVVIYTFRGKDYKHTVYSKI